MLKKLKTWLHKWLDLHDWQDTEHSWFSDLPYRVEVKPGQYEYYTLFKKIVVSRTCSICGEYSRSNGPRHGNIVEDHHKRTTIKRTTS